MAKKTPGLRIHQLVAVREMYVDGLVRHRQRRQPRIIEAGCRAIWFDHGPSRRRGDEEHENHERCLVSTPISSRRGSPLRRHVRCMWCHQNEGKSVLSDRPLSVGKFRHPRQYARRPGGDQSRMRPCRLLFPLRRAIAVDEDRRDRPASRRRRSVPWRRDQRGAGAARAQRPGPASPREPAVTGDINASVLFAPATPGWMPQPCRH